MLPSVDHWLLGPLAGLAAHHRGAGGRRTAATASPPPTEEASRGNEGSGRGAAASSQAACLGGQLPENVTIGSITRCPLPSSAGTRAWVRGLGPKGEWGLPGAELQLEPRRSGHRSW